MKDFLRELKRRKVYTIAVAYVVVAWILLQAAATVLPIYDTPAWVLKAFTTLLFLGFPLALTLAWVYDLTSRGVIRTDPVDGHAGGQSPSVPGALTGPNEMVDASISLPSGPSIALLPFQNLSGDTNQDLFAQALGGDIVTFSVKNTPLADASSAAVAFGGTAATAVSAATVNGAVQVSCTTPAQAAEGVVAGTVTIGAFVLAFEFFAEAPPPPVVEQVEPSAGIPRGSETGSGICGSISCCSTCDPGMAPSTPPPNPTPKV